MRLGYVIFAYENKHQMYSGVQFNECDQYRDIYSINRFDPTIKIRTKKNISNSYDNFTIVSEKFKFFCEGEKYKGLEFISLPNSPCFYWFKIYNVVAFDAEAYGTRFINYNERCNGYEEIIGATPARLKVKEPLEDGFFRTDLCFGSFQNKFPLELIGVETFKKLKSAGLNEFAHIEILDNYK